MVSVGQTQCYRDTVSAAQSLFVSHHHCLCAGGLDWGGEGGDSTSKPNSNCNLPFLTVRRPHACACTQANARTHRDTHTHTHTHKYTHTHRHQQSQTASPTCACEGGQSRSSQPGPTCRGGWPPRLDELLHWFCHTPHTACVTIMGYKNTGHNSSGNYNDPRHNDSSRSNPSTKALARWGFP